MMSKLRFAGFVCAMAVLLGSSIVSHAQNQEPVPASFFGMSMTGGEIGAEPWPTIPFAGIRLWDSEVPWSTTNPAQGVYDWRLLDIWMNHAEQNNVDIDYCFGRVPAWISSDPTDTYCANEPGSCDPPRDLNPDGTGTNQAWRDFVTAIVLHSAGRIHYWELWDEFPNPERWHWHTCSGKGKCAGDATIQQLARMAQDAHQIIKSIDPTAQIISQSGALRFAGDDTRWALWAQQGIDQYVDRIAFHSYVQPAGNYPPIPETLQGLLTGGTGYPFAEYGGFYGFMSQNNMTQPVWDTEGSWAADIAGLIDPDEQAGFLTRFYAMNLSTTYTNSNNQQFGPVQRFDWYEYDNTGVGALWQWIPQYDVVLPNTNGNVSVMNGWGDGTFQVPSNHGVGANPDAVAVGSFTNDQETDIVVANKAGGNVTVLLNSQQNPGTFEAGITSKVGSAGSNPVAIAVGDFNQDGNLDVVVANSTTKTVTVMLGEGDGSFSSSESYPVGTSPSSVAVADFNNDGYPDIAVTNSGDGTVTVLLNNGSAGGFTPAPGSPYTVGNSPSGVAVADFNQDGYPDLAVSNAGSANVSVYLNNGAGGGFTPDTGSPYATGNGPSAVTSADFNNDNYPDLAIANETDGTVTMLLNNGKSGGGFTPQDGSPFTVGKQPISIIAEDFNGDGYIDVATADAGDGTVASLNRCLTHNCKKFNTPYPTSLTNVGTNPLAMAVGAFNVVGNNVPGTTLKAGYSYSTTYNWLVGNTITPACTGPIPNVQQSGYTPNQGVWTCGIQSPNGNQAQLVWYMDETLKVKCQYNACTYVNYTVPNGYTQYQNVYGETFQVPKSGIVSIGYLPILLENGNAPVHQNLRHKTSDPRVASVLSRDPRR
jgi:hypothetical protein